MTPCEVKVLLVKSGPMAPAHQLVTAVLRVTSSKTVWQKQEDARRIALTSKLRRPWIGLRIVVRVLLWKGREFSRHKLNKNEVSKQAIVEAQKSTHGKGVKFWQKSLQRIQFIRH